jgi:hypothetical protein
MGVHIGLTKTDRYNKYNYINLIKSAVRIVEFYMAVKPGTLLPVISAQGETVTSQINFALLFFGYHLKCLIG